MQQSIFARSAGLAGILPSIVQPAIPFDCAMAAFAATGESASPIAQSAEISSRITQASIGGER